MSLKRALYSLLLYLIFPLVIFRLLWRSRSNPAYRQRMGERLGLVKADSDAPVIWLHAVSVGETIAAKPLIEGLLRSYPKHRVLVTTTTPTGSDTVKALFGERVAHVYFPYDLPEIIYRFLKRMQPQILLVMETEIWPNLLAQCANRQIPVMLLNARLSTRSTQRYLKIKPLVAETLANITTIAVRSEADAQRFKQLGASEQQLMVAGNIKFDVALDAEQLTRGKQWRAAWGCPVWVAASTHAGEDEIILAVYQALLLTTPDLLLVLVPRHPERFDEVFALCEGFARSSSVASIKAVRHSQMSAYQTRPANIILGDSMGEMQSWFAAADVVFMGGSLVATGGHNPLEAIALGVPVVSGAHMFNFDDISPQLNAEGLLFMCDSAAALTQKLQTLLAPDQAVPPANTSPAHKSFAQQAEQFMQQHRGVSERLLSTIKNVLKTG